MLVYIYLTGDIYVRFERALFLARTRVTSFLLLIIPHLADLYE